MQKLFLLISISIFSAMLFTGCGDNSSPDGMDRNEIVPLTETQVSNFIGVLPVILEFSEKYNASLSESEKSSPNANRKYFNALKKSSKFNAALKNSHFTSAGEVMQIYKNVVMEYTEIKRNLTNFSTDIAELKKSIDKSRLDSQTELSTNSSLSADDRKQITAALSNDEYRFNNILLVKKYELSIDQIVRAYQ